VVHVAFQYSTRGPGELLTSRQDLWFIGTNCDKSQ